MDNYTKHCTLTATLRRFSSFDEEDYREVRVAIKDCFEATFYANGNCSENKGHVSIIFEIHTDYSLRRSFTCVASVIDSSGSKRFTQSLAVDTLFDEHVLFFERYFGFEKFLKRSTLLSDPSELLPGDCLTLCLEIDYITLNCWKYTRTFVPGSDYLRLDSEFGRELCKMSTVFRDMMECPMVESESDLLPLSGEDYKSFRLIHSSLAGFTFKATVFSICKAYLTADKYDMQPVVQLCHQLLISVMREMNTRLKLKYVNGSMHHISELAERFEDDERLREILSIYSELKNKIEGCNGELYISYSSNLETGWDCKYREEKNYFSGFLFKKNNSELLEIDIYK